MKKGCATFAYFSVTVQGNNSTTTVTATAGKVGTVTVSNSTETLELLVTAQDMAMPDNDTPLYAIQTTGTATENQSTTGGKWTKTSTPLSVGTIKLENANENDTVNCGASIQVKLSGNMLDKLKTGDAFITLSGLDGLNASEVDLSSAVTFSTTSGSGDDKTATATFTSSGVELTNSASSKTITATVWLVNKKTDVQSDNDLGNQNYLAGRTLTVEISTQVSDCSTTSSAGD